jgi:hypothetical protein
MERNRNPVFVQRERSRDAVNPFRIAFRSIRATALLSKVAVALEQQT